MAEEFNFNGGDEPDLSNVSLNIDLSKVGVIADPGQYLVEVKSAKPKVSAAGNVYILLVLNVMEPEEWAGVTIFENVMLSNAGARTRKAFETFQGEVPHGQLDAERIKEIAQQFVTATAWVEVVVKNDRQGNPRNEIARYL